MIKIGTALGQYEVTAHLGAGGMGEVWRACDTQLGRDVALKILPGDFAEDPDRHARFEREAKVLASLNAPNIATLYGIEHFDGQHVLVMELVEGEGLDELIGRGPIRPEDAADIALQIAHGLEAAHESGVVHRDLKPANVRIRPDGTVKVLDFGLAKTWEKEGGDSNLSMSPTLTAHATAAGVILGTAAYMSPEQARGRIVDRRADIWSFGVVLWEMLTGRRLFTGDTVTDVLAAVLTQEVDFDELPAAAPPALRRLIERCLVRKMKQRLQWIGDARLELENTGQAELFGSPAVRAGSRAGWIAGLAGLLVSVATLTWSIFSGTPHPGPLHVNLAEFGFRADSATAISADGRWVAQVNILDDSHSLRLRGLDSFETIMMPVWEGAENPFFAPDGSQIAFFAPDENRSLKIAPVDGSPARTVSGITLSGYAHSGTWLADGNIIIDGGLIDGSFHNSLILIPASGGEPKVLTRLDGKERRHHSPSAVEGTPWVLFTVSAEDEQSVAAVSLETGERHDLLTGVNTATAVEAGYLVAYRPDLKDLVMTRFDADTATVSGPVVSVLSPVGSASRDIAQYALSLTGTLIYNGADSGSADDVYHQLILVDLEGEPREIDLPPGFWMQPRFSPDGQHVLIRRAVTPNCQLWTVDLDRNTARRFTFEHDTHDPLWDPAGSDVIYGTDVAATFGVYRTSTDGSGSPELIFSAEAPLQPASWSADGRRLALATTSGDGTADIWMVDFDRGSEPQPFLTSRLAERHPHLSPDGRWLAYASNESGQWDVIVRPYPGPGGKIQVSTGGGEEPLWSPRGDRLFYRTAKQVMMVDFEASATGLKVGRPEKVMDNPYVRSTEGTRDQRNWDLSSDGLTFAMLRLDRPSTNRSVRLVIGWLDSAIEKFNQE